MTCGADFVLPRWRTPKPVSRTNSNKISRHVVAQRILQIEHGFHQAGQHITHKELVKPDLPERRNERLDQRAEEVPASERNVI